MRSLQILIAGVLAVTSAACFHQARPAEEHAMRNGYVYLGERWVNGGADHDTIHVGRKDGRFTSIMLVVENAPIELFEVVATFGDAQRFAPPTRLVFGPDTTTRSIDLPGGARILRRVDFRYGNLAAGRRAKVELWGR
jgi:hypothetical protein